MNSNVLLAIFNDFELLRQKNTLLPFKPSSVDKYTNVTKDIPKDKALGRDISINILNQSKLT